MTQTARPTPSVWAGRLLSALVVLVLLADASIDLFAPAAVAPQMAETGFPLTMTAPLGGIVLICALLYALPATAFIGAILVTGFAGGAIAMHFRMGEIASAPQLISLAIGAAAWAGLMLRDDRVRALLLPAGLPSAMPSAAPDRRSALG